LLIGKPGIGKTAIVEGLAYLIQRNLVPVALQGYRIIKVGSNSLIGKMSVGDKEEIDCYNAS
jgi:ATP-dependent Clp protease ATP-binding subunit ClpC